MANATQYIQLFEKEQLDEGALNVLLDVLGFIPGVGEAADFTNTVLYLKKAESGEEPKKNLLLAALSAVALFPVVGDVIGKGGKVLVAVAKSGKLGKGAAKGATKGASKLGPLLAKVKKAVATHKEDISKMFDALAGQENALQKYAPKMKEALFDFVQNHDFDSPKQQQQASPETAMA